MANLDRPGATLAARPLHFIFLLDGSGSMSVDGKIDALNDAIRGALPDLRELAAQNPFVQVLVRAIVFGDGAHWHIADPTPVAEVTWEPVVAGGYTDFGRALSAVAEVLTVPPMEERAFPPVLVAVSDGLPTDDFEAGIEAVLAQPWGRRAVRLAIAIGSDADLDVLSRFIADPRLRPFTAGNAEQLAYLVRFVSTAASRLASRPVDDQADDQADRSIAEPDLPQPPADRLVVW
jgi:uncharacterized protein YegL